jgi:penicillin G amidase
MRPSSRTTLRVAVSRWLFLLFALGPLCELAGCERTPAPAPPLVAQTSGTIAIVGLTSPVRVIRDRWGVPHIYAANQHDLFMAQGFVQAQDRLFQMDLWLRASQGRLAEILGANFAERDAMTRRIQYRGDRATDWASFGPDAKSIAEAFVQGINAWANLARERPPVEFAIARWPPTYWSAEDLLNRTDAFVSNAGTALAAVERAHLPDAVAAAVRLVGTPPFFVGTTPPDAETRSTSASRATATAERVTDTEVRRRLSVPPPRYFVHLVAPGWNVIGATAPWLPGVAIGHNDRVAWGMMPVDGNAPSFSVERRDAVAVSQMPDAIRIKGRPLPLTFVRESTEHGVEVASDRERHLIYTMHWDGLEPGTAAELGALAIDRARTAAEFRDALTHWKTPARQFVYADVDGASHSAPGHVEGRAGDGDPTGSPRAEQPAVFAHVLGVGGRGGFNVGPVTRPADDSQMRMTIDLRAWDRSQAINAPGQSGTPSSAHYSDAATLWSSGGAFELSFGEDAVRANAAATLTLVPR